MKKIILTAIIALTFLATSCANNRSKTNPGNQNFNTANGFSNTLEAKVDIHDWRTYYNQKYGYSVRYPENYRISQFEGMGVSAPITPQGSYVRISDNENPADVFSIRGGVIEFYSEQALKNYFTATTPNKVTLSKIQIGGETGYRVVAEGQSPNYEYFFVQKPHGSVIEVDVLKGNDIGLTMLSTLSFD